MPDQIGSPASGRTGAWLGRLAAAVAAGLLLATTAGAGSAGAAAAAGAGPGYRHACGVPGPRRAACLTLIRTNVPQRSQASLGPGRAPAGAGYGPASLQNAYLLPSGSAGAGQTVAVVDAYDDPKAAADLATYRADWGLPACTQASGCFRQVNQNGQSSPLPPAAGSSGWATEESLDIQMVSAICPNCHILLVEADSTTVADLGTAVNTAVRLGAGYVSNSYGAAEYSGETSDGAAYFNHPGVVLTASAGDSGYGPQFPAASPTVVAVGGTSLSPASNARGWSETAWSRSGSGCSAYELKPSWQADAGCAGRTIADVSADADPNTGVAIYDSYDQGGWLEVGGTSVAAPIIASVYALVGSVGSGTYPASYLYAHAGQLNDVTSGSNGACSPRYLCTAGPGYDGPTGLGTPDGIAAFGTPSGDIVTVVNPGDQTAIQDMPFRLSVRALDSSPGQRLAYRAQGLPPGLSIDAATGLISGTPATVVTASVKVTVTDGTGASGYTTFPLAVAGPVSFTGPGPQAGYAGQPVLVPVHAVDAVPGQALAYAASGLPAGVSLRPATGTAAGLLASSGYYRPSVTATDSAGRSASETFVWSVGAAQASGRAGQVRLGGGRLCLAGRPGAEARLSACGHTGQAWRVEPDGTVRSAGGCLAGVGAGSRLQVCSGRPVAAQQWRIGPRGELVNLAHGRCLTVTGTVASGARLGVGACAGSPRQRWAAPPGPLVSGVTGECADSGQGSTGHLQIWGCANTRAQVWALHPDGTLRDGGKCLAVAAGAAPGAAASLARCAGAAAQQWRPAPAGTVVNAASGLCLADPGGSAAGSRLVVSRCHATPGQLWRLE